MNTETAMIPTNTERGYREGFDAFYSGLALNSNPYDPEGELELFEGFADGWGSAQIGDFDD